MAPSLLVVTVTYNSSSAIGSFLSSLATAVSSPFSTIIVDNASADVEATRAIVSATDARLIALDENGGYGAGITAGIDAFGPSPDYILVVNPDVHFAEHSIDTLLEIAEQYPDAGSVGPRILDPDDTVYPSARNLPSLRTGIGHAVFSRAWPNNPWTRRYRRSDSTGDTLRDAGWLSGACLLVRSEAYNEIGGFDPSFFMYFEDVDLGARLGRAGWRNLYAPQASVVHTGAHSTSQNAGAMERVHHESAYRFLSRKYTGWYLAPLRLAIRFALAVRVWWRSR
ncbi:glycosyltransferase family 2 protein [Leifsonia poae]|uniref:glycosyltransferase family 2 protein n=1 Tax=Leifsonia poae TaxID=110933 RepID=UPI001CBA75C8|nr:glycosyltransferase family 2 protein [Leifsonia poae]